MPSSQQPGSSTTPLGGSAHKREREKFARSWTGYVPLIRACPVCETENEPEALRAERGWRGFCIKGELDFSLVGVLAKITGILAGKSIPVFTVSTFDTDYVFIKKENAAAASEALKCGGYRIIP